MTPAADVLSVATLLVSVAALVATAIGDDPSLRRLAWARRGSAGAAALLAAAGVPGLVAGFALGVASLAALLGVCAIWLSTHRAAPPLEAYLDRLSSGGDAAWRAEFERPFGEYVRARAP